MRIAHQSGLWNITNINMNIFRIKWKNINSEKYSLFFHWFNYKMKKKKQKSKLKSNAEQVKWQPSSYNSRYAYILTFCWKAKIRKKTENFKKELKKPQKTRANLNKCIR